MSLLYEIAIFPTVICGLSVKCRRSDNQFYCINYFETTTPLTLNSESFCLYILFQSITLPRGWQLALLAILGIDPINWRVKSILAIILIVSSGIFSCVVLNFPETSKTFYGFIILYANLPHYVYVLTWLNWLSTELCSADGNIFVCMRFFLGTVILGFISSWFSEDCRCVIRGVLVGRNVALTPTLVDVPFALKCIITFGIG